jgi:predicted nuclease of predicted toxin-antitoxin system
LPNGGCLLSLRIYLDDCAYDKELVRCLEQAGHQVVTPAQAGLTGRADDMHFRYAIDHQLVLLTKNPDDFLELHQETPDHSGILVIYQDNDPERDMSAADIGKAITNLMKVDITIGAAVHVLNAWRY